jgi:alginate O-acetyltransferase complex protein AlgI
MVFSSIAFIYFFLPCALAICVLPWRRWRNGVLLALSLIFYAWGETEYTGVLILSIVVNYLLGLGLSLAGRRSSRRSPPDSDSASSESANSSTVPRARKLILISGIAFNVGMLLFYKFSGFFAENFNAFARLVHIGEIAAIKVRAPLGISFFTFHALSYLIDIYRAHRGRGAAAGRALRNPLDLALYLSFFPKVLAGPIVQYHDAQSNPGGSCAEPLTVDGLACGIERFVVGLAKKVLLANPLALAADSVFSMPASELSFGAAWIGILCFSLQIYFDFSGYTDMAVGLGRMFGFHLPENFNYPYMAQSVRDFWRRWHMTLSRWLRDYLYIPLGGNRCSRQRQYFNLVVVFLLCGLWHGANWNFVVWGLWYGLFLVLERTGLEAMLESAPRPCRHAYTLFVVVIGWVFFRSDTFSYALFYLGAMAGLGSGAPGGYVPSMLLDNEVILCLTAGILFSLPAAKWSEAGVRLIRPIRPAASAEDSGSTTQVLGFSWGYIVVLGFIFLLSCMSLAGGTHRAFIYFRF